ncbi:cytochrome-c peroxidase [Rivularia sp. UHCC 0363]|uniref:cytochrome-c peroxidase n=1 Tax=Rivularia sp. UHCC 0363 TaxID=3110244 RepID=UPI002B218123|nr:cytochrome c peroxidase [Rivularia sp. UHCC 0363]MEA5596476.1 cytochrome c peroxidase [Rivularia sp. UHCC 0363]
MVSTLFKKTRKITISAVSFIRKLTSTRVSNLSRQTKRGGAIATLVMVIILVGSSVSAQLAPFDPLSKVNVPRPSNIDQFIKDKTSAIALGKSLFWDMQVGSDGIQSCASCHFNAGADSRSKNQINPGFNNRFDLAVAPNYQLQPGDYPFHRLENPDDIASTVLYDTDDVTGSQGVFRADFVDVNPGSDKDVTKPLQDTVFNVNGVNVRRVTTRNTPTVIDAVFNFRNFWDGRAQNIFNGVNPFGLRDKNAFVLKAPNKRQLRDVKVKIDNASLASQAVGPPVSAFEIAAENDDVIAPFRVNLSESEDQIEVLDDSGSLIEKGSAVEGVSAEETLEQSKQNIKKPQSIKQPVRKRPFKRFGRKLGKKLIAVTPLNKQVVASDDSVLGSLSKSPTGLNKSYEQLVQDAFQREWWDSNLAIRINPDTGKRRFIRKPKNRPLTTNEYTLMEYNFALFFGLAVQEYESTLISDQTPFDQFLGGNQSALTAQQLQGFEKFQRNGCIGCHAGSELTTASVSNVKSKGRIQRAPFPPNTVNPVEDTGFFAIGVRPPQEDVGVAGKDEFDNSLSESTLAFEGKFKQLLGEEPPVVPNSQQDIIANGAFKTPGLRNIELTAPYFHNGGQSTLEQVVDFYNRGGDFGGLRALNLTPDDKQALVAFLKGLTDERVRNQQAPFDHPQLFVPNGHPNDQNSVVVDSNTSSNGVQQAQDSLLEIPAVGRNGGKPLAEFLEF